MTERDCATVDVELLVGNTELIAAIQHLNRERFVQFPQTDVVNGEPVTRQQLWNRVDGPDAHLVRLEPCDGHAPVNSQWRQATALRLPALHQHQGASTVR